jgi:hypothetical protein
MRSRVSRASIGSLSAVEGPLRTGYLAGMVHEIAGDQRLLALRGNPDADVARRMAQCRNEADLVTDPVTGLDEIDEPGIPNRVHRVGKHRRHVLALVLSHPMSVLDAGHQITRLREGRDPTIRDQHRVPADVVDMKMRANDRVDRLALIAGRRQIRQETRLQLVPGRYAAVLLVVAEAGVDDDAPARRFDDQSMNAQFEPAPLIRKIGVQPANRQYCFGGCLGQDEPAAAGHLQLDDLGDRHRADPPFHRRLSYMNDEV